MSDILTHAHSGNVRQIGRYSAYEQKHFKFFLKLKATAILVVLEEHLH